MRNIVVFVLILLIGLCEAQRIYPAGWATIVCEDVNRGITFDF